MQDVLVEGWGNPVAPQSAAAPPSPQAASTQSASEPTQPTPAPESQPAAPQPKHIMKVQQENYEELYASVGCSVQDTVLEIRLLGV